MTTGRRFRSSDLELFPDDNKRYEIIDGELYVTKAPHGWHQMVCTRLGGWIDVWDEETGAGIVLGAPGVIFGDEDDVIPDLVWVSTRRFGAIFGSDGHFHAAPDVVVEVLSPGARNQQRDKEIKLALYSRRGVFEYWIVDWQLRSIEVYRRDNAQLHLAGTLYETDNLESPLLPGFSRPVASLFRGITD